jgi:Flp pilus assembly protein TadD
VQKKYFHRVAGSWISGALLLIATFAAYLPSWNGKPIWDDDHHLTTPALQSVHGLVQIWTTPDAAQQYYPLVHTAFWVAHRLWGDLPLGYHLLNIMLHAASAILIVKILQQLKIKGAWLAAGIFALHPVQVESVAWISELKNTLSGVFFFASILAYLGFDRNRNWKSYLISLTFFILGLLSKTAIAPLPVALLTIFWWKRGKLGWKKDFAPIIPFFVVGMAMGLFTAWVERTYIIGGDAPAFNLSVIERFLVAGRVMWFYLGKLIAPGNLTFIYPRWNVSQSAWRQYLFLLATGVTVFVLWMLRKRTRAPFACLLFFLAMLFPALGFFNIYPFQFSFVADHFQYLACLGPITLASAGACLIFEQVRPAGRFSRKINAAGGGTLMLVLGVFVWRQCGMYADIEKLYRTTLERNPACWLAYNNLGVVYLHQGRLGEAAGYFIKSLEFKPDYSLAHNNLGIALEQTGRMDEAIIHFRKAIDIKPDYPDAFNNLGTTLCRAGKADQAIGYLQKAAELEPDNVEPLVNLGHAYFLNGMPAQAIPYYERASSISPSNLAPLNGLTEAFLKIGDTESAIIAAGRAMAVAKSAGREQIAGEIGADIEELQRELNASRGTRASP